MNRNIENIDDVLSKYLAAEANADEVAWVENWLRESEANQKYFNQLQIIFVCAAAVPQTEAFDSDAAWNKVKANLRKPKGQVKKLHTGQNGMSLMWRIAAGIIIALGIGIYLYTTNSANQLRSIEVFAEDRVVADTLPNGSPVFLNKQTEVRYSFNKKKKTHEVDLNGEAFFNVKHDKGEHFIIKSDGVFIRDIGTSFNVKAYPNSDIVEVLVEEGEVIFYTEENPGIHLKASGKGVYNKKTKSFTIEEPEPNMLAYKTKFFIFSGTDLASIVASLNHVYEKQIVIPSHLKKCTLTVSFRDETIEEIAEVIAETLGLSITTDNNTITLEGPRCE